MALNYIWIGFILIAFIVALLKLILWYGIETGIIANSEIISAIQTSINADPLVFQKIVDSTFAMSETAFEISIGLTGTMALWMGLMKVGERGGIVKVLSVLVGPFFKRIFPSLGVDHPAMTPILMNFSANMLGLDNAATPLGLEAMHEMQKTNKDKDTASDPMIMFLVLNTSGLTLIPITVLMYRAQAGAAQPSDVFIPILLTTAISSIAGLIIVSLYQKINLFDRVVMLYLAGIISLIGVMIYTFTHMGEEDVKFYSALLSNFILFSVIASFVGLAFYRRINAYEAFIDGAKEGFNIAVRIIPYLVAMLVSIGIFRASGMMDIIINLVKYGFAYVGLNSDFVPALPVGLMKPLSGSGARGLMVELMSSMGPDTFASKVACTMQGATDTTLYIIAVYFGAVNIKKTRYAIGAGLFADAIGVIAAIVMSYVFFH
ncbi:nucleoside recognition domain-containing protein [Algivirga pacifica]|uniref:Nucleoside recognition domain-containing protein n=1 Tax=Algivirga pacifica TaxID=1162670 RepID=A0ABP9D5I0_9BACT